MELLSIHVSPSSVASVPLFRNILFSTMFSISFSLCSSLMSKGQVEHPQKTTNAIILYLIDLFIRQICTCTRPQNDAGRSFAWPATNGLK